MASAIEAAHHRALADAQGACGLLVGEAGDVHCHEDVAEVTRKRSDRRVELGGFERGVRLDRVRVGNEVETVGKRLGTESTALGPLLVQEVLRSARSR